MNATARKFGHPDSLLHESEHWWVLLRPAQVTLGSLVLVCKDPAARFGEISTAAAAELKPVTSAIERALAAAFDHDRINYLMLMMVDPDVHFHVIPRYENVRRFAGHEFGDDSWPGPPDVTSALEIADETRDTLRAELARRFIEVA